jgi:hypothetical protein
MCTRRDSEIDNKERDGSEDYGYIPTSKKRKKISEPVPQQSEPIDSVSAKHQSVILYLVAKFIISATNEMKALEKKIKFVLKMYPKYSAGGVVESDGHSRGLDNIWSDVESDDGIPPAPEHPYSGHESDESTDPKLPLKSNFNGISSGTSTLAHPNRMCGSGLSSNDFFGVIILDRDFTTWFLNVAHWVCLASSKRSNVIHNLKFRIENFELQLASLVSNINLLGKQCEVNILAAISEKGYELLKSLHPKKYYDDGEYSKSSFGRLAKDAGHEESVAQPASRQRKKRLRSRNRVIDQWLNYEAGEDSYADLEDFLVE